MGQLLVAKPGQVQMLGGGCWASTLLSRLRAMRVWLSRLALNYEVACPRELDHYVANLQVRLSESCTPGALRAHFFRLHGGPVLNARRRKNEHEPIPRRVEGTHHRGSCRARLSKQAPRMFTIMLGAQEALITDTGMPPYFRVTGMLGVATKQWKCHFQRPPLW